MEYVWDPRKREATILRRGLDFVDAERLFEGHRIEWQDARKDYGEVRMNAVGRIGIDFVHVTYTDRGDSRRIISMRVASRKEIERWRRSVTP